MKTVDPNPSQPSRADSWNQETFAREVLDFAESRGVTKFTEDHVVHYGSTVHNLVANYLNYYKGDFPFLLDMQFRLNRSKPLSDAQVKGVLNSALADARKVRAKKNPEIDREMVLDLSNVEEPEKVESVVPNGTFTVIFSDPGDYVTLRITECNFGDFPEGSQVAAFLSGPDNEASYTRFAIVQGKALKVWKRFANGYTRQITALKALVNSDDPTEMGLAYAMKSGRCWRCGRTLTVPTSLFRGMGSKCAQGGRD